MASYGGKYALGVKRQGEWQMCTYKLYFEQCCTTAKAFIEVRGRGRRGREGGRERDGEWERGEGRGREREGGGIEK